LISSNSLAINPNRNPRGEHAMVYLSQASWIRKSDHEVPRPIAHDGVCQGSAPASQDKHFQERRNVARNAPLEFQYFSDSIATIDIQGGFFWQRCVGHGRAS
jgi:hypothetical protein